MKKIFILTGEASGDKLASKVISKLKKDNLDIDYLSVGGESLKALGIKSIYNLKEITLARLDETFELVLKSLPNDRNFYSYIFTGGGAKIRNFYNYFRTKFGYEIQFLEPPKSCGIPKVLNDASIMSLYSSYWLLTNNSFKKEDFVQKIDSFSNKIWYKRFVDLL